MRLLAGYLQATVDSEVSVKSAILLLLLVLFELNLGL